MKPIFHLSAAERAAMATLMTESATALSQVKRELPDKCFHLNYLAISVFYLSMTD